MKCLVVVCYVAIAVTAAGTASAQSLTAAQIAAAIEWGAKGDPQPVLLHHQSAKGIKTPNPVIVGAIYTPYTRVALASQAALRAGKTLAAADVPDSLLDPATWIALRWYGDVAGGRPLDDPQVAWMSSGDLAADYSDPSQLREPLWIKRGDTALKPLGDRLPFEDVAMVAAFPTLSSAQNNVFLVYRHYLDGSGKGGTFTEIGVLTAGDALALGSRTSLRR